MSRREPSGNRTRAVRFDLPLGIENRPPIWCIEDASPHNTRFLEANDRFPSLLL